MIFKIITLVVQKSRILWPLKWENTLPKHPPKGILRICVWQLLSESFKNICEEVKFSTTKKKWNERLFRYIPKVFISVVKAVLLCTSFSSKYLSMANGNFWTLWQEHSVYGSKIENTKKKKKNVVKTLLKIFLAVKTEWPNIGAPR